MKPIDYNFIEKNTIMKKHRNFTFRLPACLCAAIMTFLLPVDALAQRKLVPIKCNEEETAVGFRCIDSLFVEEGTLPPDSCQKLYTVGTRPYKLNLLFTNYDVKVTFRGQDANAAEFIELSKSRGVINNSNAYLLDESVRVFLELLQDEVGSDQVVARGTSQSLDMGGPFTFYCSVPNPQHYNYWKVMQLWALSRGADTTDADAVEASQIDVFGGLHLADPCFVLVSVRNANSAVTNSSSSVSYGAIQLSGSVGRYTLYDISGRLVTQGELIHGDEHRVLQVNPGVYVLLSATNARTIVVLP